MVDIDYTPTFLQEEEYDDDEYAKTLIDREVALKPFHLIGKQWIEEARFDSIRWIFNVSF